MDSFEKMEKARKLLGLFESATIPEVEKQYKKLLLKWHPDRNMDNQEKATEMTSEIIESYKLIMEYFMNYKIPFSREEIRKYSSLDDWWLNKFGTSPFWAKK